MTMLVGMYDGLTLATTQKDTASLCRVNNLPTQLTFVDRAQSWAAGMWSSYYIHSADGAGQVVMTVPMLVGPGAGASGQTISPQAPTDTTGAGSNPTTMTLADVGAGVWDAMFRKTFQMIAAVRPTAILRIGWEVYGNWYPWGGVANAADYAQAFRRLHDVAIDVAPGFQFDWNGAWPANTPGWGTYNPLVDGAYPGDAYVDYITSDVYDQVNNGAVSAGAAGWAQSMAVLQPAFDFTVAHGKKFAFTEFGLSWPSNTGHGDDPAWVAAAYQWMRGHTDLIAFAHYFNNNPSATDYPQGGAMFSALFGSWMQQQNGLTAPRFISGTGFDRRRA